MPPPPGPRRSLHTRADTGWPGDARRVLGHLREPDSVVSGDAFRRDVTLARARLHALHGRAHVDLVDFAVAFRRHESEKVLTVEFISDLRKCRTEILTGADLHVAAAGFFRDARETGVGPVAHQRGLQTTGAKARHVLTTATAHADPVHHHAKFSRAIDDFDLAHELRLEANRTPVLAAPR